MTSDHPTRRDFVKQATAAAVGSAVVSSASSYARVLGANDRLRVGIVGFSERGMDALFPAFLELAPTLNCEIAAVSDIWSLRREEGVAWIKQQGGTAPAAVRNNDELYARKDIDAVIISTADFQHAPHAVEAMEAGRDVYVEKPLANRMEDARRFLETAEQTGRIVQVGTQRRSSPLVHRIREYLQSGDFGDLIAVEIASSVNQPDRWHRPELVKKLRKEDTDWQRWLAGRTNDAFDPQKYIEFRLFWPYSSGIPGQWMVHPIDALHYVTGQHRPRNVVVNGGVYCWRDGRVNPDTVTAVFEYGPPDTSKPGWQVIFTSRMGNSAGNRELYYSNRGTLDAHDGQVTPEGGLTSRYATRAGVQPNLVSERSLKKADAPAASREMSGTRTGANPTVVAHMRNWIESIRSRKPAVADARAGYDHAVTVCMTVAALQTGRRVSFDDATQSVLTD
jgi:predicted dehydrogenase